MGTQSLVIRLDLDGRTLKFNTGKDKGLQVSGKKYCWKGTDADLVELIYALRAVNLIGVVSEDRSAEIKEIAQLFGEMFGKELPKIYYTRMMNQKRKKDKTPFLNRLIRAVLGGGKRDGE